MAARSSRTTDAQIDAEEVVPATVETVASLPDATDEENAVTALANAGWPGRTATETLDAAKALASAKGRLAQNAAENVLAKAAAKAAGATGLAQHDRTRVSGLYDGSRTLAQAASEAAPTRPGTARALVWFMAALEAAEAAV